MKEPTIHLLCRWKGKQRFQRKRGHEMWTLKLFLDSSSMTLLCIIPGFPMERPMLFSLSIYFTFMGFFFSYFITIYLLLSPMSEDPWCCLSDFRLWMASHQLKPSPSKAEVLYIPGNQYSWFDPNSFFGNTLTIPSVRAWKPRWKTCSCSQDMMGLDGSQRTWLFFFLSVCVI